VGSWSAPRRRRPTEWTPEKLSAALAIHEIGHRHRAIAHVELPDIPPSGADSTARRSPTLRQLRRPTPNGADHARTKQTDLLSPTTRTERCGPHDRAQISQGSRRPDVPAVCFEHGSPVGALTPCSWECAATSWTSEVVSALLRVPSGADPASGPDGCSRLRWSGVPFPWAGQSPRSAVATVSQVRSSGSPWPWASIEPSRVTTKAHTSSLLGIARARRKALTSV